VADDIVQELHDWQHIVDKSRGDAVVVMLSGRVFGDAATEINRLRAALAMAVSELSTHEHWGEFDHHEVVDHFMKEARRG